MCGFWQPLSLCVRVRVCVRRGCFFEGFDRKGKVPKPVNQPADRKVLLRDLSYRVEEREEKATTDVLAAYHVFSLCPVSTCITIT